MRCDLRATLQAGATACENCERAGDFKGLGAKNSKLGNYQGGSHSVPGDGLHPLATRGARKRAADAVTPRAKFLQAAPKPVQAEPRNQACIFLDSFVRFGAFQRLTSNPSQKKANPLCRQAFLRRKARGQTRFKGRTITLVTRPSHGAPRRESTDRLQGAGGETEQLGGLLLERGWGTNMEQDRKVGKRLMRWRLAAIP